MPVYKFYYFDARAHGELCRLVFGASGTSFEDIRISGKDWPSWKTNFVTEKLPVLSVDGKTISQSRTIARFLAREFGLAGSSSLEMALIDEMVDICDDLFKEHAKEYHERDEIKKEEVKRIAKDNIFPKYVSVIMKLQNEHGENGYSVGDKMTLADLAIYDVITYYHMCYSTILDDFPEMKTFIQKIEQHKHLKDYLNRRPETKY